MSAEPQIVLYRDRATGPTVFVGPFDSQEQARAWINEHTPAVSWGGILLQPPTGPPDWNWKP